MQLGVVLKNGHAWVSLLSTEASPLDLDPLGFPAHPRKLLCLTDSYSCLDFSGCCGDTDSHQGASDAGCMTWSCPASVRRNVRVFPVGLFPPCDRRY